MTDLKKERMDHHQSQPRRCSRATSAAILWIAVATCLSTLAHAQSSLAPWETPTSIIACYLSPTDVDDLGWSFWHNKARLTAHNWLVDDFPSISFVSRWFPNFPSVVNKTAKIYELVDVDGCNIVVSLSISNFAGVPISEIVQSHPKVQFLHFNRGEMWRPQPPNIAMFGMDVENAWYVVGAAMGRQAKRCVGVVYPFARLGLSLTAMLRGMRSANANAGTAALPFYAVELGSFYDVVAERRLGELFLQKGCDVLLSWSDSKEVPQLVSRTVSNATSGARTDFFSVGYAGNVATYTGDSVLVSFYVVLEVFFFNMTVNYINRRYTNNTLIRIGDGIVISEISPFANGSVSQAVSAAKQRITSGADDIFCSPIFNANGTLLNPGGNCLRHPNRENFVEVEQGVTLMKRWQSYRSCAAGSFYRYSLADFSLTCTLCPANTFSRNNGSANCEPCVPPLRSEEGATSCFYVDDDKPPLRGWEIALIVVGCVVVTVLVVGLTLAVTSWRINGSRLRSVADAPRGPDVSIAMLGVDRTATDPGWRKNLERMCTVYDAIAAVVNDVSRRHHIYAFVSVGDVYMIASPRSETLYHAVTEIIRDCHGEGFPGKVVMRVCCHHARPTVLDVLQKDNQRKVNYVGPDVDVVRGLWATMETNGRLCVTASFLTDCCDVIPLPLPALMQVKVEGTKQTASIALLEMDSLCPAPKGRKAGERLSDSDNSINPLRGDVDGAVTTASADAAQFSTPLATPYREAASERRANVAVASGAPSAASAMHRRPSSKSHRHASISSHTPIAVADTSAEMSAPASGDSAKSADAVDGSPPSSWDAPEHRVSSHSDGLSSSNSNSGGDDDYDIGQYIPSQFISRAEHTRIRDFGAQFITSFIRVLAFQHQIEVVSAVAEKLHIRKPQMPADLKMRDRRSYNLLRNPIKNIASQVVTSMEEVELRRFIEELVALHEESLETATTEDGSGDPLDGSAGVPGKRRDSSSLSAAAAEDGEAIAAVAVPTSDERAGLARGAGASVVVVHGPSPKLRID